MRPLENRLPRRVGETFARVLLGLPFILGGLQHLRRTDEVTARLTKDPWRSSTELEATARTRQPATSSRMPPMIHS